MVELATTIWADGPASVPYEPQKSQIRSWGTWIEQIISAFTSNGGLIYSSLALLNADLAKAANSMAWVIGDPITATNGVYGKVGASGTGSWVRRSDLPFSFIVASDTGAGTPNAIQATTAIPVSQSALVWLQVAQTNTGSPVVVSFNGGGPLVLKTNTGNDPAAGGIVAGMVVLGIMSGATFRLVSDQASSAIVAAAEAAQAAAEAAAASINIRNYATKAQIKALNTSVSTLAFFAGSAFAWTAGDFAARIAADTAEGLYLKADAISASAGAWVRQFEGGVDIRWFGASTAAADNAAAYLSAAAMGTQIYIPEGTFTALVTAGNLDAIRAMLTRCYGPGTIDLFLATGVYTTGNFYGFTNQATVNVTIRGENLSGSLTAASVTFAGTALNYTAAITFPALPSGIAIGQLLSLVTTVLADKRSSQSLLAGSNKITNIVGNVVTVSIPYHGTVTTKMPTIVGTVSFTGAWRLNKSVINYTGARTPIYIQSPLVRLNVTDIGLTGLYVSGGSLLSSGITVGWTDEDRHYVKDQIKLSGIGAHGFTYGFLGQGSYAALLDFRASGCFGGIKLLRKSEVYATTLYISNCAESGIAVEQSSGLFAFSEVMSCGNAGRGVWCFSGEFNVSGAVFVGYNVSAGLYAKAGAKAIIGVNSAAFRNNNIGWGNEFSHLYADDSISEYNLISGYEAGVGTTSALRAISRFNENGFYALIGGQIFIDDCESHGNTQNGVAVGEGSTVRGNRGNFHDNAQNGISVAGNSHFRGDNCVINANTLYGIVASINSSARVPGVSGTGGTSGKTNYDATSTGTTW